MGNDPFSLAIAHLVDIDGDEAHAESYGIGLFLNPDGVTARLLTGRYIDRLDVRNGEAHIAPGGSSRRLAR